MTISPKQEHYLWSTTLLRSLLFYGYINTQVSYSTAMVRTLKRKDILS